MKLPSLFGGTRGLEAQIDLYFDKVQEAGLVFGRAMEIYLDRGVSDEFDELVRRVTEVEEEADDLRREIETQMTTHTLIPELREDVLSLIEQVDEVTNHYEAAVYSFYIQRPVIAAAYRPDFAELARMVQQTAEEMVTAARAFFRDLSAVRDHVKKVQFYESEADKITTRVGRQIFESDLDLAHKMHLTSFLDRLDSIADTAEDIGDKLSILTIKRMV
ncbi:DUF47 domain-containing protein [Deinococcota bacterium DY0809b]